MIRFNTIVEYHGEGAPNEATAYLKGLKGVVTGELIVIADNTFATISFEDGGIRFINLANVKAH